MEGVSCVDEKAQELRKELTDRLTRQMWTYRQ
jgi:hypothetical protein